MVQNEKRPVFVLHFFEPLAVGKRCRDPSLGVIRERMTPLPQDDNVGGMEALTRSRDSHPFDGLRAGFCENREDGAPER